MTIDSSHPLSAFYFPSQVLEFSQSQQPHQSAIIIGNEYIYRSTLAICSHLASESPRPSDSVNVQLSAVGQVVVDHKGHLKRNTKEMEHVYFQLVNANDKTRTASHMHPQLLFSKPDS